MKIKVVVHEAEEGGYWAEVPAIPGCATQGETFEELLKNLYEAIEGCLSVDLKKPSPPKKTESLKSRYEIPVRQKPGQTGAAEWMALAKNLLLIQSLRSLPLP